MKAKVNFAEEGTWDEFKRVIQQEVIAQDPEDDAKLEFDLEYAVTTAYTQGINYHLNDSFVKVQDEKSFDIMKKLIISDRFGYVVVTLNRAVWAEYCEGYLNPPIDVAEELEEFSKGESHSSYVEIAKLNTAKSVLEYVHKLERESLEELNQAGINHADIHHMRLKLIYVLRHLNHDYMSFHERCALLKRCRDYVEKIAMKIQYELPKTTHEFYSLLLDVGSITEEQCNKKWKVLWDIKYPKGRKMNCVADCDDC